MAETRIWVGERGPELFIAARDTAVLPRGQRPLIQQISYLYALRLARMWGEYPNAAE